MSIVIAAANPTTVPAMPDGVVLIGLLSVGISLLLAMPAGVFRRRSVEGPDRLGSDPNVSGLFIVTAIAMAVWYAVQAVFVMAKMATLPVDEHSRVLDYFSPSEFATLVTLPGVLGAFILMGGDAIVSPRMWSRLGIGISGFMRGVVPGLIGILIVLPLIYGSSLLSTWFYERIGYEHPAAHDLLLKLNEAPDGWPRWGLIAGAVLVAPIFEELLFRAHIQTLLLAFFQRFARNGTASTDGHTATLAAVPLGGFDGVSPSGESVIPYAQVVPPAVWPRWAAIILCAILFAAIHAAWTAPPIFVLAIALGYAYERTGSLWTTIIMHALFNGLSTYVYVNFAM